MQPLLILFWVSTVMAVFSFGLFAAVAIQRIVTTARLAKQAESTAPKKKHEQTLDTEKHAGFVEAPEKFVESLSKLTEALSKAPLLVTTLIAAIFFTTIALAAAALAPKAGTSDGAKTAVYMNSYRCKVYFGDADDSVARNRQNPDGCLEILAARLRKAAPSFLLLVGRVDSRELTAKARSIYTTNFSLAYQRAVAVSRFLLNENPGNWTTASDDLKARAITLAAGPSRLGRGVPPEVLQEDRVVEATAFWNQTEGYEH